MGFASYIEDILERLESDLNEASRKLATGLGSEIEFAGLLRRSESAVVELRKHLDLATDPALDLAHELILERERRQEETASLVRSSDVEKALRTEIGQLKSQFDIVKGQLRESRKEKVDLEKKLVAAFEKDPSAIYDAYLPPDKVKRRRNE